MHRNEINRIKGIFRWIKYVVTGIVFLLFCYYNYSLTRQVQVLKEYIESTQTTDQVVETLSLEDTEYYQEYLVPEDYSLVMDSNKSDFMLYYHSPICGACLQTNVWIDQYIRLGYQQYLPVYFVTKEQKELWQGTNWEVTETPTLLYFHVADKTFETFVGVDEITIELDRIVQSAKEKS